MDNIDIGDVIEAVLAWHDDEGKKKRFDPDFIFSVSDHYKSYGKVTEKQENAIYAIIDRWHIDVEKYLD